MPFDPQAPLPGAPDPWSASRTPALRDRPPYLMTEMIAAEPALAQRLVTRLGSGDGAEAMRHLGDDVRITLGAGGAVVFTGCGTSEHAAMAAAALLADAVEQRHAPLVQSRQALDVAVGSPGVGLLIGISHEGGTWATNEALRAAHGRGAMTALITVSARSPGAALADYVIETGEQDQSWCHTVGYLSPLIVASVLAGQVHGAAIHPATVRGLLEAASDPAARDAAPGGPATGPIPADEVASHLAACERVLVVGGGIDVPAARELALKIEEGCGLPATALHLETLRHGHLAAADLRTGLILLATGAEPADEPFRDRGLGLLRAARELGMPASAILGARVGPRIPQELTPAGRLQVPEANDLPPAVESILACAVPLQLLAERLARARGRNPDLIGRENSRQAAAAGP